MRRSAIAVVAVCLALTGCAPTVEFEEPIAWAGGTSRYGQDNPLYPLNLGLFLDVGGHAEFENFPRGTTVREDDKPCVRVSSERTYSGAGTWRVVNMRSIEVRFEESEILIISETLPFNVDWTGIVILPCGTTERWTIGLVCGKPNPQRVDPVSCASTDWRALAREAD